MGAEAITHDDLERVTRDIWGSAARLLDAREILPVAVGNAWRVAGCTNNRSYIVRVDGQPGAYVYRFNVGFYDQDRYDHEARTYDLVRERTAIPVPRVHRIDRSQTLVPTSYMVLDWLPGEEARYLAHPDCPTTSAADKRAVLRLLGDAYAQMHAITRPAASPDALVELLVFRLEQLQHVVEDGQLDVDLEAIHRAIAAVRRDPDLRVADESLCVGDAELHLLPTDQGWALSFICDMEWVDYGNACLDLANLVTLPDYLWAPDAPIQVSADELAARPWVAGYAARRPLGLPMLARRALYAQMNVVCSFVGQVYRPERHDYMVGRTTLYRALMDAVAAQANG